MSWTPRGTVLLQALEKPKVAFGTSGLAYSQMVINLEISVRIWESKFKQRGTSGRDRGEAMASTLEKLGLMWMSS